MMIRSLWMTGLLFFTALLSFSPLLAVDAKASDKKSFVAEIRDLSGNLLSDAELVLSPQASPLERQSFKTNKNGRVEVAEGTYKDEAYWLVQHPVWSNKGGAHLKIKKYHSSKPFSIKLTTGPGMKGIVVDEKDKEVVGAKVSISRDVPAGSHTHRYEGFDITYSTLKGEFKFPALAKAKFWLNAELENKKTFKSLIIQHPSSDNIVLKIEPANQVNLMTFDKQENKIKDYNLSWYVSKEKQTKYKPSKQSKQGRSFVKEHETKILVPKEKYIHISINSKKHKKYTQTNIELRKDFDLRVHLEALASVSGLVLDSKSQLPVKGAKIRLERMAPEGNYKRYYKSAKADDKGTFKLFVESPNEYFLSVSAKGYLDIKDRSFSMDEEVKKLKTIDMDKGESFRLRLIEKGKSRDENRIISNHSFTVKVRKKNGSTNNHQYQSDASGVISVDGLEDGYTLLISSELYAEQKVAFQKLTELKDIVFTKAGHVEVKVTDENGDIVEKLRFSQDYSYNYNNSSRSSVSWYKMKFDKAKQVYTLKGLAPKMHRFTISSGDKWLTEKSYSVDIKAGQTTYKEINIKKAPYIYIKLNEEAKKVNKQLQVHLYEGMNYGSRSQYVSLDKEKGMYQVYLNKSNYRSFVAKMEGFVQSEKIKLRELSDENKIYEVVLRRGLKVSGKVLNENEEAVENVRLRAERIHRIPNQTYFSNNELKSDADGAFELTALQEGEYNIIANHKDYTESKTMIRLKESKENYIIRLSKGFTISGRVVSENNETLAQVKVVLSIDTSRQQLQEYYGHSTRNNIKTDSDGKFIFKHLKKGLYKIDAQSSKYGMGSKAKIELKEGEQEVNVDIIIKEGKEISGKVVDESGTPLAGIDVNAYNAFGGGGQNIRATTKDDGAFRLYPLKAGSYSIYAQNNEYQQSNQHQQAVYMAGKKDIVIKLKKKRSIKGIVKTPDGKVLSNIQVFYRNIRGNYENSIYNIEFGENNEFSFKSDQIHTGGLANETIKFIVKAEGYNPGESKIYKVGLNFSELIEIELKPEKSIEIHVQNIAGDRLAGVDIQFNKIGESSIGGGINFYSHLGEDKRYTTDKDGKVQLKGIARGKYQFNLSKSSYASLSKKLDVDPDSGVPLNITLYKGGIVSGIVYAADGSVKEGSLIVLVPVSSQASGLQSSTDREGKYEIKNVPPGVYKIEKQNAGANSGIYFGIEEKKGHEFEIQDGQNYNYDIREEKSKHTAKIEGHIPESEGQFFIAMLMKEGHTPVKNVQVQGQTFVMEEVPAGDYLVMVTGTNGISHLKKNISIKDGEHLNVQFEAAKISISARVVMEDGQAVPFSQAVLLKKSSKSTETLHGMMNKMEATAAIQNGEMKLKANQAGDYQLAIGLDSRTGKSGSLIMDVSVSKDEHKDLGTLTLKKGKEVRGRVVSEDSSVVPHVQFVAYINGFPVHNYTWRCDENGDFKLDGFPSASSELTVSAQGYITKKVKVDGNDLNIQLEKALELEVSLAGTSISSRAIVLCDQDGKAITRSLFDMQFMLNHQQNRTDSEGKLTLKNISEGTYRLKVMPRSKGGTETLSDPIQVTKGTPASILISILD